MEYIDESILQKREELRKQKYMTLENGYYVMGKILNFEEQELCKAFRITIPENFWEMPEELARIKYPSEFRPGLILTTLDLSVNMGFCMLPSQIQTKDSKQLADKMMRAIHRSNSNISFYEFAGLGKLGGYYFTFKSHAMDSDVYNMIFSVPWKDTILQCSFNCLYPYYKEWKPVVKLMWESIQVLENTNTGIIR